MKIERTFGITTSHPSAAAAAAEGGKMAAAPDSASFPDGQLIPTRAGLEENCGVYGVVGASNASRAVFFAL